MTYREKFYQDHADMEPEDAMALIADSCPQRFYYAVVPEYCQHVNADCNGCWNREIPDELKPILMRDLDAEMAKVHSVVEEAFEGAPVIKDSGDRTEFATGAVRDMRDGKGRMDLLPWSAIMEVSKHCENGAKKYGEHNVDKGIPTNSLCDSAARHLAKYLEGWTDEPHLVAAAWNLLWAIQMEIKHPELVNTPYRGETSNDK